MKYAHARALVRAANNTSRRADIRLPRGKAELYETREYRVFEMRWFEHLFGLIPYLIQQVLEVLGCLYRLHAAQRTFWLYADHAAPDFVLDETPHLMGIEKYQWIKVNIFDSVRPMSSEIDIIIGLY